VWFGLCVLLRALVWWVVVGWLVGVFSLLDCCVGGGGAVGLFCGGCAVSCIILWWLVWVWVGGAVWC